MFFMVRTKALNPTGLLFWAFLMNISRASCSEGLIKYYQWRGTSCYNSYTSRRRLLLDSNKLRRCRSYNNSSIYFSSSSSKWWWWILKWINNLWCNIIKTRCINNSKHHCNSDSISLKCSLVYTKCPKIKLHLSSRCEPITCRLWCNNNNRCLSSKW